MRAKQKVRKCAPEELSEIKETLELYVSYQTRGRWRLRKLGYMWKAYLEKQYIYIHIYICMYMYIYMCVYIERYVYRCIDVYRTKYTECTERKCSEILAWGQIPCSGFGVGLPRFPNLTVILVLTWSEIPDEGFQVWLWERSGASFSSEIKEASVHWGFR